MAVGVILGDWGSTRLRLWFRQGGTTVASSDAPGLLVTEESPAQVLRGAIGRLGPATQPCPIVLCGMAGARGGLAETPYVACPAGADEWVSAARETSLDRFPVIILPGFSGRDREGRPDAMRGEEAQVFGALALQQAGECGPQTIVLPGTHSKWVAAEGCRITHFATCPTGELYARLIGSSLAPRESGTDEGENAQGFSAGIERAHGGEALIASMFEARAAQLLDGRSGDWSRGFLSGLLIGSEIAAMGPRRASGGPTCLIGSDQLAALYRRAFSTFGVECRTADGEICALGGLEMAYAKHG